MLFGLIMVIITFKFKDINIFNTYLERGRKSLARYYVNLCSINPKNIYKREFDLGEINIDNFKIAMWVSLDSGVFIKVTSDNADELIRYLYERFPY